MDVRKMKNGDGDWRIRIMRNRAMHGKEKFGTGNGKQRMGNGGMSRRSKIVCKTVLHLEG